MDSFISALVPVAVAAVAIVLLLGLVNMMRGGSPNTSQTLMRTRVLLQFVAIIIIMGVLWYRRIDEALTKTGEVAGGDTIQPHWRTKPTSNIAGTSLAGRPCLKIRKNTGVTENAGSPDRRRRFCNGAARERRRGGGYRRAGGLCAAVAADELRLGAAHRRLGPGSLEPGAGLRQRHGRGPVRQALHDGGPVHELLHPPPASRRQPQFPRRHALRLCRPDLARRHHATDLRRGPLRRGRPQRQHAVEPGADSGRPQCARLLAAVSRVGLARLPPDAELERDGDDRASLERRRLQPEPGPHQRRRAARLQLLETSAAWSRSTASTPAPATRARPVSRAASGARSTICASRPTAPSTRPTPASGSPASTPKARSTRCCPASRTSSSTSAPTSRRRRRRSRCPTSHCASSTPRSSGSSGRSIVSTKRCRHCAPSSSPAGRRRRGRRPLPAPRAGPPPPLSPPAAKSR